MATIPVIERLMRRVEMIPIAGCWLWTGAVGAGGYGVIYAYGVWRGTHRVSWMEHIGPIPPGLQLLHQCDVRCCVNPAHLVPGTQQENMTDMLRKNRARHVSSPGERNGRAILTAENVAMIRASSEPTAVLATRLGIGYHTVWKARRGATWGKHGQAA